MGGQMAKWQFIFMMVPLLLNIIYCTGGGNAQLFARHNCPSIESIRSFRPDKLLGEWHVQKQIRVGAESEMTCKKLTFSSNNSVYFDFVARSESYSVTGLFFVDSRAHGIVKAKFKYSDVLGSQSNGEVVWHIISTDYKSFLIIVACYQEQIMHSRYLYVLSRKSNPSLYQLIKMDIELGNTNFPLDTSFLTTLDNRMCDFSQDPLTSFSDIDKRRSPVLKYNSKIATQRPKLVAPGTAISATIIINDIFVPDDDDASSIVVGSEKFNYTRNVESTKQGFEYSISEIDPIYNEVALSESSQVSDINLGHNELALIENQNIDPTNSVGGITAENQANEVMTSNVLTDADESNRPTEEHVPDDTLKAFTNLLINLVPGNTDQFQTMLQNALNISSNEPISTD